MIDIREHGGPFGGGKPTPDFVPRNFNPIPSLGVVGSYHRVQIAKTFAVIRRGNQIQDTIDIETGAKIASTTASGVSGTPDMHAMVADEHDDFIHGYHHEALVNTNKPRAYNRSLQKVWESAETASMAANSGLTKNFVFFAGMGKLYKVARVTGITTALTNTYIKNNVQLVFGNSENDNEIIYLERSLFVLINVDTGETIKTGALTEAFANINAYPYGVCIRNGALHIFTFNSQDYLVQHWVYPINATTFDSTTRILQMNSPNQSWENGNTNQAVRNIPAGILLATNRSLELINFKLGDISLKKVALIDKDTYRANGNGINYINLSINGTLPQFGRIKGGN